MWHAAIGTGLRAADDPLSILVLIRKFAEEAAGGTSLVVWCVCVWRIMFTAVGTFAGFRVLVLFMLVWAARTAKHKVGFNRKPK